LAGFIRLAFGFPPPVAIANELKSQSGGE
jgi:hypothetical protein